MVGAAVHSQITLYDLRCLISFWLSKFQAPLWMDYRILQNGSLGYQPGIRITVIGSSHLEIQFVPAKGRGEAEVSLFPWYYRCLHGAEA
jgi:hypothetical protein